MANLNRYLTAATIVNRAAIEVGLAASNDVFASADPAVVQLRTLLTSCGQTLIQDYPWQRLLADYSVTTTIGDPGVYDLPDDFSYMIDQTGWQRGGPAIWPLQGPASPQTWSYLVASSLYRITLFAWFRLADGKFEIFPSPVTSSFPISFQYISRGWIKAGDTVTLKDTATANDDLVLFEPILIVNYLKLKFKAAKGFDTTTEQKDFDDSLNAWESKDAGGAVLNQGRTIVPFYYLGSTTNIGGLPP